ncbi:MAG TPA: response regulator [bacterium]|nr:response regulator [bacterium]
MVAPDYYWIRKKSKELRHIFHILIADKNRHVREFLRRELIGEGYAVRLAGDGNELLRILDEDKTLDLLIVDPDVWPEGVVELVKRLQARWPGLPAVAHTFVTEAMDRPGLKGAFAALIEKSGNPSSLKAAVGEVLRRAYPDHFVLAGRSRPEDGRRP